MLNDGAPLVGVWPPALPDALRLAVASDAGDRGFSHVFAPADTGPVLLLAADALVVWSGPGSVRGVGYDAVRVVKRGMGRWRIEVPASDGERQPDHAPEEPTAAPLWFDVGKHVAAMVSQRAERVRAAEDNPATAVLGALDLQAARVGADSPPAALELARPVAAERAADPDADLQRGTTGRLAALAQARVDPSVDRAVDAGMSTASSEAIRLAAEVVSVLSPVGYVRVQPRGVLMAAASDGRPLLVGERVSVTIQADGTLVAAPDERAPRAEAAS